MLPRLLHKKDPAAFQIALEETSAFVKGYGSYLKMHTCIAYSALLKAEEVIDILLESAKYDPRHREMMKVTSKANALVFYEPVRCILAPLLLAEAEWRSLTCTFCFFRPCCLL
jgi:hypothetical protein